MVFTDLYPFCKVLSKWLSVTRLHMHYEPIYVE